jgi:hypothetical protein
MSSAVQTTWGHLARWSSSPRSRASHASSPSTSRESACAEGLGGFKFEAVCRLSSVACKGVGEVEGLRVRHTSPEASRHGAYELPFFPPPLSTSQLQQIRRRDQECPTRGHRPHQHPQSQHPRLSMSIVLCQRLRPAVRHWPWRWAALCGGGAAAAVLHRLWP